MQEIGGYIELDTARGKEFHENAIKLNSGRHCLEYLIRAKDIQKIYLPDFLCASVKELCEKCGCAYELYQIDASFHPVFEKKLNEGEYVYIVNYYGQITNDIVKKLKDKFENIILDNAQAFFQLPIEGVDTLYTCRKFFGVSDGGYLYTDVELNKDLPVDFSYERIHYILGRFEKGASEFYQESSENNKFFKIEPLKQMSKLTRNILKGIDYTFVQEKRTHNFKLLHDELAGLNKLKLIVPDGAFMYPFYCENGNDVRKHLQKEKIYIPTLWPDVFLCSMPEEMVYEYAENILPLPIDQRYGEEEMRYLIKMIKGR